MPSSGKKQKILPGIQYLRGICALMVVFSHAAGLMGYAEYFGSSPADLANLGKFGVSVFFAISGYIIVLVSLDERLQPTVSLSKYARRRVLRILPFFWLCVIGYNALTFLGSGTVEWLAALKTLVVWPSGELKPNVAWSLRHEFLFYILFACAFLAGKRRSVILYAWFAAPLLFYGAVAAFAPELPQSHPGFYEYAKNILGGSEGGANLQFALGFLLGWLWLRGHLGALRAGPVQLLVASVAVGAIFQALGDFSGLFRIIATTALAAIPMVVALKIGEQRGWLHKLGMELGDASFSIYLVHNAALLIMLKAASPFSNVIPQLVFLPVSIVGATLAGIVVHRLVEAPLINFLMRRPPQATAALATQDEPHDRPHDREVRRIPRSTP